MDEMNAGCPDDLRALDAELTRSFAAERAVLPAGVVFGAMGRLPLPTSPLTRVARMISGVVLLGAGGVLALWWQWLAFVAEGSSRRELLLSSAGGLLALVALLVAFSLPRTRWWRWRRAATETTWRQVARLDAAWLLGHRLAAAALLAVAAGMYNL